MRWLRITVALLESRKAQAAIATAIVTILAAFGLRDFPSEVIIIVVGSIATLGGILINAIKAEDVAAKNAAGMVAAAQVTAAPVPAVQVEANNVEVKAGE